MPSGTKVFTIHGLPRIDSASFSTVPVPLQFAQLGSAPKQWQSSGFKVDLLYKSEPHN